MGIKEEQKISDSGESETGAEDACPAVDSQKLSTLHRQTSSIDNDAELCRVCHCVESDRRGDAALGFLNILPPSQEISNTIVDDDLTDKVAKKDVKNIEPGFVEFISPEGEVFVCSTDLESGSYYQQDALIDLGCSCKNELALTHYACALKWFISHGSTNCEICGSCAKNVRLEDFKKVMASLKEYEALKERTATGEVSQACAETNSGVDPDALAAIRRQRLSEVSLWFNPHSGNDPVARENVDQLPNIIPHENIVLMENPTAKWAVEGTAILVATGLLTVFLAWLIGPHVGKRTAKSGLHILLGGICALTIVLLFRFVIFPRIKYGPARYWAILFVFWFLVFGIWASRTHGRQ